MITDDEIGLWLVSNLALPLLEQTLDMMALRVVERHSVDDPPGLPWVVVRDRRLEPLPLRRRLAQLPAQPAQERNGGRCRVQSRSEISGTAPRYPPSIAPIV
jgi:hypothetical protein